MQKYNVKIFTKINHSFNIEKATIFLVYFVFLSCQYMADVLSTVKLQIIV